MTHHRPPLGTIGTLLAAVALGRPSAAEPASDLPPPDVSLRVEAANLDGPWKLVVTNRSAASLRFAADGRLLRLEVRTEEEPKKKKGGPTTCRLPAGLRPSGVAEDRSVVLPPGARYEEHFAPLLYCFADKEKAALAPGTKLVPILGFDVPDAKPKAKPKPPVSPFVAEDSALVASVAPVKAIVGEPFTVPEAPRPPPAAAPARTTSPDAGAADLVVTTPARLDAAEASSIDLAVTVTNRGKLPATVRLRRDLFTFEVNGPNGPFRCGSTPGQRTVPRDLYDALRGGAAQSLSVRLVEPCPDDAFSRPGLYAIRARLVANTTPERTPGVRPWTGEATATKTTLLRVRTGDFSYYRSPPVVITAKEGG
jgi:hypothetical protein